MLLNLFQVFYQVVTPVVGISLIGYIFAGKLHIDTKSLNRTAYYFFVPAFVFHTFANNKMDSSIYQILPAVFTIQVTIVVFVLLFTKISKKDRTVTVAYIISSVFPNIGNFAIPLLIFRFGEEIIFTATLLFLIILMHSFIISIFFAAREEGIVKGMFSVIKTPAIISFFVALVFSQTVLPLSLPLPLDRMSGLMGDAMIAVMLFTMGAQLAEIKSFKFDYDVIGMSLIRLVICPIIALVVLNFFSLNEEAKKTALIDFAMPSAVLASIIATEYKIIPEKMAMVVLVTTLGSVVTLSILLTVI